MELITDSGHTTAQLWQQDHDHFFHPYTNFKHFPKEGAVIYAKGEGHHIFDHDGQRYLDGIAGLWCVNIGHGRREIAEVMAEQALRLAYYNTFGDASSPPAARLSAKLAAISPGPLNHVFYSSSGSVANDTAIKIAHYYFNQLGLPDKKLILSRDQAYHGSTYLAHALTGIRVSHLSFDLPTDLVHYLRAPYSFREAPELTETAFCDLLIEEMEAAILRLGPERIACFIAEPIMGAGGVIVPPANYQKRTKALCEQYGILYISDEVVTAFGRLGHLVASEDEFGVVPDMLVMAKGISSGYVPLGATMISDQIYDVISRPKAGNPYFSHGFTYSGHALSCAVGLTNIELMEKEDLCGHVRTWGPYFKKQLQSLEDLPIVGEVRGSHYMLCVEYVQEKSSRKPFDPKVDISKRIYRHCKENGLILRPIGNCTILSPPLTYDQEAIDQTVEIIRSAITATLVDLRRENLL
ncbi:MAG: aminotransferase [Bacteroidota bacterium]